MKDIMKELVNRITIDLDEPDIKRLLLTYINARKWFDAPVSVEVSSSGTGFHVIIDKSVTVEENLMWRAFLGDDPVRISYSLRRILFGGEKDEVDILFVRKNGSPVRKIDIDKVFEELGINPHDVNENNFEEVYNEVLKKLKPIIGKIYYLVIPVNDVKNEVLSEIYNNEGIKIRKAKAYDKEHKFFLLYKKVGDNNFDDVLNVISKYIEVNKHWIKEEEIR